MNLLLYKLKSMSIRFLITSTLYMSGVMDSLINNYAGSGRHKSLRRLPLRFMHYLPAPSTNTLTISIHIQLLQNDHSLMATVSLAESGPCRLSACRACGHFGDSAYAPSYTTKAEFKELRSASSDCMVCAILVSGILGLNSYRGIYVENRIKQSQVKVEFRRGRPLVATYTLCPPRSTIAVAETAEFYTDPGILAISLDSIASLICRPSVHM